MTGTSTRPAIAPGSAPSIPATATIACAARSRSTFAANRCSPAIPMSRHHSTVAPKASAVTAASAATAASAVPAVAMTTQPTPGAGSCRTTIVRASGSQRAFGRAARTASAWLPVQRVARTVADRSASAANAAVSSAAVLPAP